MTILLFVRSTWEAKCAATGRVIHVGQGRELCFGFGVAVDVFQREFKELTAILPLNLVFYSHIYHKYPIQHVLCRYILHVGTHPAVK